MGVNPDQDDDTEILNPDFDDASIWVINGGWSIAAGHATAIAPAPLPGTMKQTAGFRQYFRYRLTFTMANVAITDPVNDGLKVTIGGVQSGLYSANGVYTFEAVASDANGELVFTIIDLIPLDHFDLDTLVLEKMENYVETDLEIFIREPKRASTVVAVATDYYTSLSSRDDNSSCLISFDLP